MALLCIVCGSTMAQHDEKNGFCNVCPRYGEGTTNREEVAGRAPVPLGKILEAILPADELSALRRKT